MVGSYTKTDNVSSVIYTGYTVIIITLNELPLHNRTFVLIAKVFVDAFFAIYKLIIEWTTIEVDVWNENEAPRKKSLKGWFVVLIW